MPREHLKDMMAFEADRITGLVLTDAVVRPELNVVLEEQNMRVANNPNSRLAEQIDAALYLNHPYGRPVIGWRPEIEASPRRRACLLPALLHAEQRDRRRCGRRDRRRGQGRRRGDLRQDRAARRNRAAPAADGAGRRKRRGPLRSPTRGSSSRACSGLISCPARTTAKPGESRGAGSAGAHSRRRREQPALPETGRRKDVALNAGAYYSGTALDYGKFGVYAVAEARQDACTMPRRRSTRCWPT